MDTLDVVWVSYVYTAIAFAYLDAHMCIIV